MKFLVSDPRADVAQAQRSGPAVHWYYRMHRFYLAHLSFCERFRPLAPVLIGLLAMFLVANRREAQRGLEGAPWGRTGNPRRADAAQRRGTRVGGANT